MVTVRPGPARGPPPRAEGKLPYARPLGKPISMRLSKAVSSAMAPAAASAGTCGDEKEGGEGQPGTTPPATPPSRRPRTHRVGDPEAGVGDTDGGELRGSGSAPSVWVTWGRVDGCREGQTSPAWWAEPSANGRNPASEERWSA